MCLLLSLMCAQAADHHYKYSDLIIKDYDEMNQQVQARIKKARELTKADAAEGEDQEAIAELADALRLIFSRPNSDNMVAKLTPDVRRDLSNLSAFEETMSTIARECLVEAQEKGGTVARRSTSLFMLENILSEIRPEVQGNESLRKIVQAIADAKLRIADDVIAERRVRSMFKTTNPSDMAKDILKANERKVKQLEKEMAKEKAAEEKNKKKK